MLSAPPEPAKLGFDSLVFTSGFFMTLQPLNPLLLNHKVFERAYCSGSLVFLRELPPSSAASLFANFSALRNGYKNVDYQDQLLPESAEVRYFVPLYDFEIVPAVNKSVFKIG